MVYTNRYMTRHRESQTIRGIFKGLRPVVVGLIASAALLLMNGENFGRTECDIIFPLQSRRRHLPQFFLPKFTLSG